MKARLALYQKAEKILMDDAVLMPLHWNADLVLMSKSVKNFQTYPQGGLVFLNTTVS
jgi:ABC-type transport system substrate-binding protein